MVGSTNSNDSIATEGSYQPAFYGSFGMYSDAFILKFDSSATGVKNLLLSTPNIQLYPNPNTGDFNIQCTTNRPENLEISICNLFGECVQQQISSSNDIAHIHLDAPPGMYFVSIAGAGWSTIEKVVVMR